MATEINYYCPDFIRGYPLYNILLYIKENYPEYCYPNTNIKTIFGCFDNCNWNGGGFMFGNQPCLDIFKRVYEDYHNLNIPLQLTFTNPLLEERDMYDRMGNAILKEFEDGVNHVLVSNDILEQYIKDNYPKYIIDRSIINTQQDYNWEQSLDTKYQNIVLPRRYIKDLDYLNTIDPQYRSRIELLCNDPCPIDCPNLYKHYEHYANIELFKCDLDNHECHNSERNSTLFQEVEKYQITYEDILCDYLPIDYTEFKISGRYFIIDMVCNVIPYFIKPEYHAKVIKYILNIYKDEQYIIYGV